MILISPPLPTETFGYFDKYVAKSNYEDLIFGLKDSSEEFLNFIDKISDTKLNFRYAEGKWNIREIMQHIIDCERVFVYRALVFARRDKTPMPSFEEDDYARESNSGNRDITDLMIEYKAVRKATIELYKSFDETMLEERGAPNKNNISVRAMGFIIIGHQVHHQEVIRERYLA